MAKNNGSNRKPGIMDGFDMAALRKHVETADQKRPLNQDELAAAYGAEGEVVAYAHDFPASIDELVEGIAAQDQRFLEQGRKLLKSLLKEQLRKSTTAVPGTRKVRGRPARPADMASSPAQPISKAQPIFKGSASASVPVAPTHQRQATPAHAPLFDAADYGDADEYGG